jgi:citrate lyase gamma subunit
MAIRTGMLEVLAALRRVTGADAAVLDDDALQALCDARVQTATAEPLMPVRWTADQVVWAWAERAVERDAALFTVYAGGDLDTPLTVAGASFNFERAELTLASGLQERGGAVNLTYSWFPLPEIAVDVWRTLAAAAARDAVDVRTDNHEIKRSQVIAHYLKMAGAAQTVTGGTEGQPAQTRRMVRGDRPDDLLH